ncbi:hypothetical protein [Hyphomicrobium sp.]|uniref:hypothetical protein n=1 Tax=Hyphomicrobium sp. TaxID=82 RepID=UPI000FA201DA|nr:hypothetical protein [Hyphomicrobium sp.]RUP10761.1 MAG: hypothetical protein EKK38_04435 [Hyphomicrobium sp.]
MHHHHDIKVSGKVTHIFGHRLVVATSKDKILAAIGPEAAARLNLKIDDQVEIEGEQKPAEIKVLRISVNGGPAVDTHDGPKHKDHHEHHEFSAEAARRIAEKEGFKIVGELTANKKHYEAIAEHDGARHEIHVHRDHIMKKHKLR